MKFLQLYHFIIFLVFPVMAPHGSKDPDMSVLLAGTDLQDLDPKAPLSPENLVKLLINQSRIISEQTVRNERDYTRDHINNLIKGVINGFATKIDSLVASINRENLDMVQKIDDLDLKLNTITQYLEDLVYTDRHECIKRHSKIANDVKNLEQTFSSDKTYVHNLPRISSQLSLSCHDKANSLVSCDSCGYTPPSQNDEVDHQTNHASSFLPNQSTPTCLDVISHSTPTSTDVISLTQLCSEGPENRKITMQDPIHICLVCDNVYTSHTHLSIHVRNDHCDVPSYLCNICHHFFQSLEDLRLHMESWHSATPLVHCKFCDETFQNMRDLNAHTVHMHAQCLSLNLSCNTVDNSTQEHTEPVYSECLAGPPNQDLTSTLSLPPSPLQQVDGNVSLPLSSPASVTLFRGDPTTISTGHAPAPGNVQLQYSLNTSNQTSRLVENTHRPAFTIRYSNPQIICGKQHPTNVSIDCNTGAYMSAIKPTLELITQGWQTEIQSTLIYCDDVSERSELSGRKVNTKLVLYLTENTEPSNKIKVVLHFYHTSNTIQVQGSSLLSCGTPAPVWLVKSFLEPLANTHIEQNSHAIDAINTGIRDSNSVTNNCAVCQAYINSTASQPKDQGLSCSKCRKLFHKRCTDRRKTTGNWRRTPWYCNECILDQQPDTRIDSPTPVSPNLSPSAPTFYQTLQDPVRVPPQRNIITIPTLTDEQAPGHHSLLHPIHHDNQSHGHEILASDQATAAQNQTEHEVVNVLPPRSPPLHRQPVFPPTTRRQRGSNIRFDNPEAEFQKTALDSCRSTIVQQQSEIKRLNETLDIRNKRIIQLEDQINVAASYMSSRDSNKGDDNTNTIVPLNNSALSDNILLIINKLSLLTDQLSTKNHTVNVYNTTRVLHDQNPSSNSSKATQTDIPCDEIVLDSTTVMDIEEVLEEVVPQCTICGKIFKTAADLDSHIDSVHANHTSFKCDYCDTKLISKQNLQEHISKKHETEFLQCPKCMYRSQLKDQLSNHMEVCHAGIPGPSNRQNQDQTRVPSIAAAISDKSTTSSSSSSTISKSLL